MFGTGIEQKAQHHAMAEYPKEACGVVVANEYVPCTNVASDPEMDFEIDEGPFPDLQAVIHSHTGHYTVAAPSKADMEAQEEAAVPWGVLKCDGQQTSALTWFGDQCPIAPLEGRNFIHGVYDCWGLVRDYYRLRGKDIPNFPRNDGWWEEPDAEDMLCPENFTAAGFTQIDRQDVKKGDVVAGNIRADIVNHVGVYVGNGLVLHHLYNALSRREPVERWMRYCRYFLRYTG